nr:amino acid adenylation domain-containing protein [Pyrinomonadaceae bacterium]
IANRKGIETEALIGFFLNTLVLRTDLSGDPTFIELLGQVREIALGAYEHQDLPFEKLVEELHPERSLSHTPLFQVLFVLRNTPQPAMKLQGLTLSPLESDIGASKFDLNLFMVEEAEGLKASLEFNTDLFDASTIKRMLGHFQVLLEGIVANPQQRLSALPLLTDPERHQLLVEWNDTSTTYPRQQCIHGLFETQVERTPNAIAVVFEEEQLTYGELNRRANQVAHYLRERSVGPEVRVGILMERSIEMMVALLGILKVGGSYVPLDPMYPQERLAFMLDDAEVPVLLTQRHLLESFPVHCADVVCLDTDWKAIARESEENLVGGATADNLAYVIYTSGSTGKPKGVQISHRAVVNFLNSMCQQPGLTSHDTLLAVTTLSFDIAGLELYLPLCVGARLVVASREVASDGVRLSERLCDATVMQATPATWRLLLEAGWQGSERLKILCGGEALSRELANQLLERGAVLWNLYGPTETTIWSAVYKVEFNSGPVPVGRPIANTQVYLLDQHLQPVPIGVPGELYIGGAGLAQGYLRRPELTAERFIANPFSAEAGARLYKTGDLARYLPSGEIECLGRLDHQVKIRGFRIELGEVEAVLAGHKSVRENVVVTREDVPGEKRLVAYVIPKQDEASSVSELRSYLKERLPEYMVPSAFVLLQELPLTPNGKVDRRALPVPDQGRPELEKAFVAPRTAVEELVAGVWADVLRREQVGVYDNFFDLGGHSLLATQVISRVRVALQVELSLHSLFEEPTVAGLAERVETARLADEGLQAPPIVPSPRDQELPLSFVQEQLWFLDQLKPGSSSYNVPQAIRMSGALDVAALRQTLESIIARHEALRTTFVSVDGQPVQVIAPARSVALPVIDLRELPISERETETQRLVTEDVRRPFDLAQGPLFRASLLRLGDEEYVLLINMHHIICDGWSMGVLFRELAAFYEAYATEKSSTLPQLPIQYADYAVWQREWLRGEVFEKQLAYWKQQLSGAPAVLGLPTDRPRPAVQSFQGARQFVGLPKNLSEQLLALSRREGVTLFMTLLAAFQILLSRYTGQEDIVVGTDVANRNQVETEGLIGFFINNVVMRSNLSGDPSFSELLAQVREMALAAYAHQDMPFNKLIEALKPERSLSHTPLFQVLFVLQNAPMQKLELAGLTLSSLELDSKTSKFDLAVFMEETEQGLVGTWGYKTDLFEAPTITRMAAHFETLLANIIAQPNTRLSALEMLTETERRRRTVEKRERKDSQIKKLRSARRKAVDLSQVSLIKTDYLQPGETLPLVVEPNIEDLNLAEWAKSNREFIETKLLSHGAILFRGFNVDSVPKFERFASAICPELFGEYGDLPREGVSGKVYGSTPYPSDQSILFHNESSHMHRWPMTIWFFCVQAAEQGGETPIVDIRRVYELLDPKIRERFIQKKIMYVRNYIEGLDVSWQSFFRTTDRSVVEDYCRKVSMDFEWRNRSNLRTRKVCPAVLKHPKTGGMVFFNQLQLHHVSCLEPTVRESLLSIFREEDLPRNVYYGDGSPIEDSVMEEIGEIYRKTAVGFPWREGDILMLNNMLAAHGRNPYTGPRKIVVSMGEMVSQQDVKW